MKWNRAILVWKRKKHEYCLQNRRVAQLPKKRTVARMKQHRPYWIELNCNFCGCLWTHVTYKKNPRARFLSKLPYCSEVHEWAECVEFISQHQFKGEWKTKINKFNERMETKKKFRRNSFDGKVYAWLGRKPLACNFFSLLLCLTEIRRRHVYLLFS